MNPRSPRKFRIEKCAVQIPVGGPIQPVHIVFAGRNLTAKCGKSTHVVRCPTGPWNPGDVVDIAFVAGDYAALGPGPAKVEGQPHHLHYAGTLRVSGRPVTLPTQLGRTMITRVVTFAGEKLQAYTQPPVPYPGPPLLTMAFKPNSRGQMFMYLDVATNGTQFVLQQLYYLL